MRESVYVYLWGNNPVRAKLKGRRCKLICSGTKNTVLLEFLDTGERTTTSRRAIRLARADDVAPDAADQLTLA